MNNLPHEHIIKVIVWLSPALRFFLQAFIPTVITNSKYLHTRFSLKMARSILDSLMGKTPLVIFFQSN
ncbi:hypothetical protein QVD17_27954 [Tagetes erecta]|uniref:Uncharacterized protein n=1 Tax=Tagetes erecta TaxID=13708 RepID=A0AAD8K9M1_TARER|nr:hypothetical protein QVD17_27954 [Tagetes erecta]